MSSIRKKFPGRSTVEIYERVHEAMERIAEKLSLDYRKDDAQRSGRVSKMGISGTYQVRGDEVVVDLRYPMLVPGAMRQRVDEEIERKLDGLFT